MVPTGGNGGFVETSGPMLGIGSRASVNVGAHRGKPGTWLLDPFDIDITAADSNTGSTTAGGTTTFTGKRHIRERSPTRRSRLRWRTDNVMISTAGGGARCKATSLYRTDHVGDADNTDPECRQQHLINAITGTSGGLVLTAGTTTATGSITISAPINVNAFSAIAGSSGTINLNSAGAVVTTNGGGQTYGSPVVLQHTATLPTP